MKNIDFPGIQVLDHENQWNLAQIQLYHIQDVKHQVKTTQIYKHKFNIHLAGLLRKLPFGPRVYKIG